MPETEQAAVEIFKQASEFWEKDNHEGLSRLAIENIGKVLDYTDTLEGQVALKLRARQLDDAITHFNQLNASRKFEGPDEKESKKLAEEILKPGEKLPLISETPLNPKAILPYLLGFRRLAGKYPESETDSNYYYTFLDKGEVNTPEQFNTLITGLLVDGFAGFAFRARRVAEGKPAIIGRSDLTAVNSICEMVSPGELQTEMFKSGWYKSDYGLSPELCTRIGKQFGKQ